MAFHFVLFVFSVPFTYHAKILICFRIFHCIPFWVYAKDWVGCVGGFVARFRQSHNKFMCISMDSKHPANLPWATSHFPNNN